jgi:hypothetical protein
MAVLLEERTNLEQGVADGSRAHLEQLGEHASGAGAALVENGRQDLFRVGDLLAEDTTAGSGQACPAAPLMTASLDLGGLLDRQPLDQLVQLWTAHASQGWVGQDFGQLRTPDGGAVVDEVEKGLLAGEAEGGGVTVCRCSSRSCRVSAIAWPIENGFTSIRSERTFWEQIWRR